MRDNTLKTTWADGQATLGLWLSTGDTYLAESLSQLGFAYTCLDTQHGLVDYSDAVPTLQAQRNSPAIPLARAPWNEPGVIGKLLDAGMMGIIIPMVNTAAEAEAAVAACRYAPAGRRSYGPMRASIALGPDYFAEANDQIACIPMIETRTAIANLDAILDVPGIDAVYVGPADLGITMGLGPGSDHDDREFDDALEAVVRACRGRGIAPGIHSTPELTAKRIDQGFQMITVTGDHLAAVSGAKTALATATASVDEGGPDRLY